MATTTGLDPAAFAHLDGVDPLDSFPPPLVGPRLSKCPQLTFFNFHRPLGLLVIPYLHKRAARSSLLPSGRTPCRLSIPRKSRAPENRFAFWRRCAFVAGGCKIF